MRVVLCTITGADESVEVSDLFRISIKYPFVEWGILFGTKNGGKPRYPGRRWLTNLYIQKKEKEPNFFNSTSFTSSAYRLSAHLCGDVIDQFVSDPINLSIPGSGDSSIRTSVNWDIFDRVQLNTMINSYPDPVAAANSIIMGCENLYRDLDGNQFYEKGGPKFIIQENEYNQALVDAVLNLPISPFSFPRFDFLFDASRGTGIQITEFKKPYAGFLCGYAGGISPDNIHHVLEYLEESGPGICTIDMESGVRTDNGFDLDKVETILKAVEQHHARLG